ncbi:MAG: hypothetical protein MI976_29580 [Pseudomonadales bacterium]|nr:hypothetical protein [Pseudomonadales bacterium]
MNGFIFEFFSASILMGLAIGLDAAIATGVNAPAMATPTRAIKWLCGITFTHTVFPMVGYLMSYYGLQEFPMLSPLIGLVAFYLIAHFFIDELKSVVQNDSDPQEHSYLISLGLILAVSWDALWSGPAKSAQVIEWPPLAIWTSFLVVGATVSILSTLAFLASNRFVKHYVGVWGQEGQLIAKWLQLSCVSYFGWLALARYTLDLQLSALAVLLFAFTSTGIILWRLRLASTRLTQSLSS